MHHSSLFSPDTRSAWEVQRHVVFALLLRELKTRFGGRWLGVYWVVLEPITHIAFLTALLGALHRSVLAGIDYPVFLLVGLVPFFLFKNLSLRLMEGIDANRALFGYRQVKPIDTVLARAALELGIYGLVSLLLIVAFGLLGMQWHPDHPIELAVLAVLVATAGTGLGLSLAVATHKLTNARSFARIAFMPMYFASGVITPLHALPAEWRPLLLANPLLHAVELSRAYYFADYPRHEGVSLAYVAAFALLVLFSGLALYRSRRLRLTAS